MLQTICNYGLSSDWSATRGRACWSLCNHAVLFVFLLQQPKRRNSTANSGRQITNSFRATRLGSQFRVRRLNKTFTAMERANHDNHRLHYRAAIALNNIACSLMQRGDYSDCIATLKDALNLMRDGAIDIEQALRRAQMALSIQSSQIHCGGDGHPIVHIVSSQTNPIQVGESLLLGKGDEDRILYAICIDLASVEEEDTPEVEAFTMLYNYGIAYSCMAMYCQEEGSFQSSAHRIFRTVEHWMSKRVQQDDSHSRILTVYLLLMRNLEEATAWLGSIQVASQYHQTLQQWVEYLRIQEEPLLALPCGAAAA